MATNIDKSFFQQPLGMAGDEGAEPIEIEIVDPEEVNITAGDTTISIKPGEDDDADFNNNLVEEMDEGELQSMVGDLVADIENDKASRKDWERAYTDGLKLLGLHMEERTEPWDGACGVFHPMITEAVVRFQSETITETFPAAGPVRTKILGKETTQKKESAFRVEADMNYQLTEVMKEYRPEHERMLWSLPAAGSAFKKIYYDPSLGRQTSIFVPSEDVLLPYGTTDMHTCQRYTHVMRKTKNEIIKLQKMGFYADFDLPDPMQSRDDIQKAKDKETGFSDLNDTRYTLYECNVDLDLAGYEDLDDDGEPTGIALPYIVTLIKGTDEVLAIRRNWKSEDIHRIKRQHFVHYQYIPGFGAYGFGLFHLIGGFAKSATSIMRQLVDAGTLSNLPGGLKSRGLRILGDDTPISPGEFRDVDVAGGTLRDSILPLPYKEPSNVLFQLLNGIVEEGRRIASSADMQVSDMSANAPVGTTLALLERQLKVMTAVQARVHYSLKQELGLIAEIIRDYLPEQDYDYQPEYGEPTAKREDYDQVDIIPVSDPNAATMSQRVVQYQAVLQMAQMAPGIYNMPELHRAMLSVMGVKNADKLVPLPEDQKPKDPVTENMAALKLEPLKAFFYQDHESHIKVHVSMMQDPTIQQLVGQSPQASQIQAALSAHIAEHVGFAYRSRIEQQLGMPLPPQDEKLTPEIEMALSGMMAQAAQQVLQQSQQQAAQQQAQQQAQDPVVQAQQQDMANQKRELDIKEKKMMIDASIQADKLDLAKEEFAGKMEVAGRTLIAKAEKDKADQDAKQQTEGLKIGIDVAKSRAGLGAKGNK
jgi:hypothetical protein